jgi:putative membrane protein insertion efficiency factor
VSAPDAEVTLAARPLHALVRAYRYLAAGRPSPCRYSPSCSTYALEALEVHGAGRGTWLIVRRLGRCHPWGGHGIDLVPPAASADVADRPESASAVAEPHRKAV